MLLQHAILSHSVEHLRLLQQVLLVRLRRQVVLLQREKVLLLRKLVALLRLIVLLQHLSIHLQRRVWLSELTCMLFQ